MKPMAETVNGFVCRLKKTGHLCGFRKADGQPNEWHTWTDQQSAEQYTEDIGEILPAVQYIGPDAPDWRERPTCPGEYHITNGESEWFSQWDCEHWGDSDFHTAGWVFGPIPPLPEIPQELRQ